MLVVMEATETLASCLGDRRWSICLGQVLMDELKTCIYFDLAIPLLEMHLTYIALNMPQIHKVIHAKMCIVALCIEAENCGQFVWLAPEEWSGKLGVLGCITLGLYYESITLSVHIGTQMNLKSK